MEVQMGRTAVIVMLFIISTNLACAQNVSSLFHEFKTDYTKTSIDFKDILSGGPPKDGIPAIETPRFTEIREADKWIGDREAILYWAEGNKAYPLSILMWHEIVNDEIIITYCPLCNTGIGFERSIGSRDLDFGTTGRLRYSNLLMYDRQTETWWQQATGEAVVGELLGEKLQTVPLMKLSWEQIKENFPEARILSRDTGYSRSYGVNPYRGYDSPGNTPFLYRGPSNDRDEMDLIDRVLTIPGESQSLVIPYRSARSERVIHEKLDGRPIVLFYTEEVASALDDQNIESGREVGSINVFSTDRTFVHHKANLFKDVETDSIWNSFGLAVEGPSKGTQLELITSVDHFWFSAYSLEEDYDLKLKF